MLKTKILVVKMKREHRTYNHLDRQLNAMLDEKVLSLNFYFGLFVVFCYHSSSISSLMLSPVCFVFHCFLALKYISRCDLNIDKIVFSFHNRPSANKIHRTHFDVFRQIISTIMSFKHHVTVF